MTEEMSRLEYWTYHSVRIFFQGLVLVIYAGTALFMVSFVIFVACAIYFSAKDDEKCVAAGGVPIRAQCFEKSAIKNIRN